MQTTATPPGGAHDPAAFKPYVDSRTVMAEFTLKAVLLGSLFGIIFGAATVYLALRAGLTVSASIPIAVLAIAVFKKVGQSTILENNIVQTIGSAGESIAAGVVFTVPAFLFLAGGGDFFTYGPILMLSFFGGVLGVLFMIPLRRSLIVKEHGNLPYPEGTACAEVLVAGEKGGNLARLVFSGFWVALGYKLFNNVLGLWKEAPGIASGPKANFPNATLSSEITPEYMGVGYIIGPRIAGVMVSGSVMSWLALIPLLSLFVSDEKVHRDLMGLGFTQGWIDSHTPAEWFYRAYVRLIGAGAVAAAGVITLAKSLPTIVSSFKDSVKDLRDMRGGTGAAQKRTERDIPITWVVGGSLVLALLMAVLPQFPGELPGSLLMSLLIVVFGFFFVTVSSRIVGLIGATSNPISGMTIATLMATCSIFLMFGFGGDPYQTVALCVGAVVCIAAANAGATSQDLKTGYIVGATPYLQQVGLLIGVLVSVFAIGFTINLLHTNEALGPIGSDKLPAPQPTLMATLIKGMLAQDLPWGYVFVGMGLAVVIELCGIRSLPWAVGAYLPISTTFPIFVGGMMRMLADKVTGRKEESELSSGMLTATGLVAGGSIAGILIAVLSSPEAFGDLSNRLNLNHAYGFQAAMGVWSDVVAAGAFGLLCFFLVRQAMKGIPMEGK